MLDFGGNARATNNLARETREASNRENQATHKNTEAINALAEIARLMPAEIGDNMPKYSEREVRELREEIEKYKELAHLVRPIEHCQNSMFIRWSPNVSNMT